MLEKYVIFLGCLPRGILAKVLLAWPVAAMVASALLLVVREFGDSGNITAGHFLATWVISSLGMALTLAVVLIPLRILQRRQKP